MSHVADLVARIVARSKLHAPFLARAVAGLSAVELDELEGYVAHCVAEGVCLEGLANDYKLVLDDTLREQIYFQRHGHYRFSRLDEVVTNVYRNDRYMTSYMRGLALTSFFWPNHTALRRYFLELLGRECGGRYLEVGPGHGCYLLAALRSGKFDMYEGIDLSSSSVALTERLLRRSGFGPSVRLRVGDFLEADFEGVYDMVVMGEVLEHVERPDRFLERACALSRPGATVFVTTCIDSPACDHIFLFSTVDQILALAEGAGLRVEDRRVLPHEGTSLEESSRKRLAVNVALVLRHA